MIRLLLKWSKILQAASFTLGLVRPNGLVWTKSYGYADIAAKKPANADTVYRIGSITKQFTALMLLQLVHEGKVYFSDPVEKYFPEIHQVKNEYKNAAPITLLQLANHTSGLDVGPDIIATYTKGQLADWEKTLIAALPHTKFAYEPGTRFNYSNMGYAILGAALSRAAHRPYIDYVKQKILQPLGMTHSDFVATPEIRQTLATGYDAILAGHWDEETPVRLPAGVIRCRTADSSPSEIWPALRCSRCWAGRRACCRRTNWRRMHIASSLPIVSLQVGAVSGSPS